MAMEDSGGGLTQVKPGKSGNIEHISRFSLKEKGHA